jgi:integrase
MPSAEQDYDIGRLKSDKFPEGECVLTFWRDGKRRRFRLGTSDEAAARRAAPALFAEAIKPKGTTVAELWGAYCTDKTGNPSVAIMGHQWKALQPHFGHLNAEDITIADCRAYIAIRREAGRKDGTIITELGRVRTVLNWAKKHRLISAAPDIERPSAERSTTRHLKPWEVLKLADACKAPHVTLFVHVAYATAGRAGAILSLTWDRILWDIDKIDLQDPEAKGRQKARAVVPMPRTLKLRLLEAKRGARSPFVIEWAGAPVKSVKKGLATAAAAAGLPHVHAHMLRHSSAVRQAEQGVPMEEIASHLGHTDLNVTRRIYARFSPEALSKSKAALELGDDLRLVAGFTEPVKHRA